MESRDDTRALVEQVRAAAEAGTPLHIVGGDSKAFYGRNSEATRLETRGHAGIVAYEPTELVITARAGTPLSEIGQALAKQGQMLPFDPPLFGAAGSKGATLGGSVAAGLAGPGRPWCGAPRDSVLGIKLLDGEGRVQSFGGQVMKNVAGYDIARLMAGAMGTLGVLLEVSLKVLPRPAAESTRILDLPQAEALRTMRELAAGPAPLAGASHLRDRLYLRLSGNASGVEAWARQVGGESGEDAFWQSLRDQQLDFFQQDAPLWRLSLPPATPHRSFEHAALTDWGGAQRWLYTDRDAGALRRAVAEHDGHATLFRGGDRDGEVFQPLNPVLRRFHQGLKQTFDPHQLFNRGRLYTDL